MTPRTDGVIVIGAGVAGLTAARALAAHDIRVTLIEAAGHTGGRARTVHPPALAGATFDLGATWLHAAHRNSLVALAQPEDRLRDSDSARTQHLFVDDRPATAAERASYADAWDQLDRVTTPALAGSDTTLAQAMAPMRDHPWAETVALWEGAIIAAADADRLGLQDWHRNALEGANLQPEIGVGAFVQRRLAFPATLGTAATLIDWSGNGVRVETNRGTLTAAAAVVTVSTGVLAAGALRFRPALPQPLEDAIHRLPMGLLSKIALPAPDPATFGLPADSLLLRRGAEITFNAWPDARPYVTGFVGGRLAWSLAADPAAATALAREELRRILGGTWPEDAVTTTWGTDPLHRGAYAYAGPGDAQARDHVAEAFPAERLLFAGEAFDTTGLAGTVAGAHDSAIRAVARLSRT